MQEFLCYAAHPIEDELKLADYIYRNISIKNWDDVWSVFAGDLCIYRSDSKETMDAFLYFLCFDAGITGRAFNQLREEWERSI